MKWTFLALVGAGLLFWTAYTSLTRVQSGERAVVRRFGAVLAHHPQPGLYVGLPWGMERVDRVAVGQARRITVGFGQGEDDSGATPPGQILTGDHNLVNVQAEVYYQVIEDQVDRYVLNADSAEPVLARIAEGAIAEWIAARKVDDVLIPRGKLDLSAYATAVFAERIPADLGVAVERVSIVRVEPPSEVKSAFEAVAKAQTGMDTRINGAKKTEAMRLSEASGDAYQMATLARAYSQEQRLAAEAEAAAFLKQLDEYQKLAARDPTYLNAIWVDEMTRIYARMKEAGRIDLLDHYLSKEGLTITEFPLLPKKK